MATLPALMSNDKRAKSKSQLSGGRPRCGLCGKTGKLTRTPCCGNWICDDADNYVLFSYARNSCFRNHTRYTICALHHNEGHKGRWQDCAQCRANGPLEMYVYFATNEFNFEKLANPPRFEPTHCDRCGVVIKLGTDGYSIGPRGTLCERCGAREFGASRPLKPKGPSSSRGRRVELPVNADPTAIEIILSAQAQKRWRIKPAVRASEPPAHWLAQWRIDLGRKLDRTWVALVTNTATLFTFVFPLTQLAGGRNLEQLFRLRLAFALTDAPALAKWKGAPLVFAHGNPRMAIGSMNDMRRLLAWREQTVVGPMEDDEDWINETPFLSLPESFPDKAFASRLAAANKTHT